MALKPDRIELLTDVSFFMNSTATRGGVASVVTGGVGVSMDDATAVVAYAAVASGAKPVGLLLNDVVDLDQDSTSIGTKTKYKLVARLHYYVKVKLLPTS